MFLFDHEHVFVSLFVLILPFFSRSTNKRGERSYGSEKDDCQNVIRVRSSNLVELFGMVIIERQTVSN